jgi:hypothetical protein
MKLMSMLGAATVVAFVAISLFGATSASATVQLCKKAEQPCAEAELYTLPQPLWARLKTTTKLRIIGKKTIECTPSTIEGEQKELSEGQVQVVGQLTRWAIEGCGAGCTAKALGLNYTLHIWQAEGKGEGHMAWGPEAKGKEQPAIEIKCLFGPNCTFSAAEQQNPEGSPFEEEQVWINTQITGGNPAFITTVNQQGAWVKLITTKGSMECGSSAELKAEFEVLLPKPYFIVHK